MSQTNIASQIVKIDSIVEAAWNYNTHPDTQLAQLQKSLDTFGQFKNVVVWHGQCIAGNGLLRAAKARGDTEIEVKDFSHLSDDQAKALCVADNALPHGAIPDMSLLDALLADLNAANIVVPGVSDAWLDELHTVYSIPNFKPVGIEEQPRLDQINPIICPKCGHEFNKTH